MDDKWVRRSLDEASPEGPAQTFFGEGCEIDGNLVLPRSILIEGEFRGTITSSESVVIAESAAVEADIRARTIEIRGAVVGKVEATREVVLSATGRLHGGVETPALVVERGGFLSGETRMFRPQDRVAKASQPTASAVPAATSTS